MLVAEGDAAKMQKAIELVESIKGEPPLSPRKGICLTCLPKSPAEPKDYEMKKGPKHCPYEGDPEEDLPGYLKNR